jgi:chromatin licensing and DNA replication factor 1
MSQSFKRRFSQRSPISSATASATSQLVKVESTVLSPLSRNSLSSSYVSASKEAQPEEDGKVVVSISGVSEGTPAKYASTPVRLMASTPDLKTPKRPISDAGYGTPPLKMSKSCLPLQQRLIVWMERTKTLFLLLIVMMNYSVFFRNPSFSR